MAQSKLLTVCFATIAPHTILLLHIVALCLFNLVDEVIQMLVSLSCFDLAELLTVFLGNTHLHLRQVPFLLVQVAAEHFLFSIHVIVAIEVDCLGAGGRIQQILLHALIAQMLALLLR